jgi:branched-chain amino acid transport system permease protein
VNAIPISQRRIVGLALLAAALVAWYFSGYAGQDRLGEIAIAAIFAMSLDLMVGYGGMVSLGHALFFGLGAYALAGLTLFLKWPTAAALPAAVLLTGIVALVIGRLIVHLGGVFFIMVTLAFGQMGWAWFARDRVFGGIGGLSGVPQLDLAVLGADLANPADFALLAVAVATVVYLLLARLIDSPFGAVVSALHRNANRARALGCPVQRYKLAVFTVAAMLAALAGTLQAQRTGFVSPDLLVWTSSGEVLIMVIIGGLGSLLGPIAGAALWTLLHHYLSAVTPYWMLIMGSFFVAIVLFAGEGLYGALARLTRRRRCHV